MIRLRHSCLLALFTATAILTGANTQAANTALEQAIDSRSEQDKARDSSRHPTQTLEFFGVLPGMVVAEALPGSGWYSNIVANYLGAQGTLYGVNYPDQIWPMFSFYTPEIGSKRIASTKKFPKLVEGFTDNGIKAQGFTFNTVPTEILGSVDRVLLIRALHNLNRFDATTGMLSQALAAVHAMLKDDGIVGVVQHRAPADADDAGTDGSRGYLKQAAVISTFEKAGFELVASSEINANPRDKPDAEDIVWRLPPSLSGSKDDPERQKAMQEIGESDRMTLTFRKAKK